MKVRTKAIVDAEQLTFENQAEMKKWTGGSTWSRPPMRAVTGIMIPTIFGDSPVAYGDYVIRDEEGNFYRLTPTEFEKKFEPA